MACTRAFIYLLFIFIPAITRAQSPVFSTTADKDSILVGEPITVTISITAPEAFINTYSWVSYPDTANHFEVIRREDVSKETEGGNITASQKITITSFDSGRWAIPSLTANGVTVAGGKEVFVNTVPISAADDYRDIHDIADVKKPFSFRPWLIGAAIAVTAGLIIWLIILFNKKQVAKPKPSGPRIAPLEEAMAELEKIRSAKWPEAGEYKKFHDRLDEIFRRFLHRQYQTPAIYDTNEEVLLQMKQNGMAGGYTTEIAQALRMNNFVKFAGYQPGTEQSYQTWQAVKEAIQKAKPPADHAV